MNTLAKIFLWGGMILVIQSSFIFAMDEKLPEEHLYPITLEVMRDPVVAADEHFYERESINPTAVRGDLPAIALGNEIIYEMFLNGRLLYEGKEIAQIANVNPNTLEGTFDLSGCGDANTYLSINTGYNGPRKMDRKKMVIEV